MIRRSTPKKPLTKPFPWKIARPQKVERKRDRFIKLPSNAIIIVFIPSNKLMLVEPMVKPSSLLSDGIALREFGNIQIFRFTDELQDRLELLLEKSKAGLLTPEERSEWAGITELSRIFTFINAELAAKAQWCPVKPEN
jgi:hypothetical protein